MRCINSPPVLNSLEVKVVESAPVGAKHVLVVNAGDGRLARAIREKSGARTHISAVTTRADMSGYVDDLAASSSAWDVNWYATQVATHGAFDYVVFYQLHEFWGGELRQFQRILELVAPGATVWASFVNAQARRLIARFLPPVRLGYSSLADPLRSCPNLDFASFVDFMTQIGGELAELWGLLDQDAQDFCQQRPLKPTEWQVHGAKVKIGTFADAFLWGAAVVGVAFRLPGGTRQASPPQISFSPYSVALLQALVLPYPDHQANEGHLTAAKIEVKGWTTQAPSGLGPLARFFLSQIGPTDKSKRVLLLGSGWGRDLLLLKRELPAWDWVGFDHREDLVAIGEEVLASEKLATIRAPLGGRIPADDNAFDLTVSLGHFSTIFEPAARWLGQEALRVTRETVYHLEDGRGPEQGMHLKSYSLKNVYSELGVDSKVQPVLVDGSPTGMYLLKVTPPA